MLIQWNEERESLQESGTINAIEEHLEKKEIKVSIELDVLEFDDLISCTYLEEEVWSLEGWIMENEDCMKLISSMDTDFIGLCK